MSNYAAVAAAHREAAQAVVSPGTTPFVMPVSAKANVPLLVSIVTITLSSVSRTISVRLNVMM